MAEKHKQEPRAKLFEEIETDSAQAALEWLQSRWRLWAGAAGGIVLAVIVASGWRSYTDGREAKAQDAVAACMKAEAAPAEDASKGIDTCKAVVAEQSGTRAAQQARLVEAALEQRAGKAADAVQSLTVLVAEVAKDDPLRDVVRLALARAQEASGKPADAAAGYKALRDEGFRLDEHTTLDLVRALEASGQVEEARKIIEDEIQKSTVGAPTGQAAPILKARLALLGAPPPAPMPPKG